MTHRNGEMRVRAATRHAMALGVLLLSLAAGWPTHDAQGSAQLTQSGVQTLMPVGAEAPADTTPPATPGEIPPTETLANVDPTHEYDGLIRSPAATGALDSGLLGESIDYYTGQTDFVTTDVSLPLNFALPMTVSRRYHVGNKSGGVLEGAFGDWDWDLPRIEGVVASSVGWTTAPTGPYNPCSAFGAPPPASVLTTIAGKQVSTSIPASEYAVGYSVVVPGKGRHEMLLRNTNNAYYPGGSKNKGLYPVVTKDWWAASCEPIYDYYAGQPNEGFDVSSPDGVTYSFLYYGQRDYPPYQRLADDPSGSGTLAVLPRTQVFMWPYRVTDRFGNWVQYGYHNDDTHLGNHILTSITSSDGQAFTITYTGGVVTAITDEVNGAGKKWTYSYTSGSLSKVTLPDGSYWSINFANLNKASWVYTSPACGSLPTPTYPSGSSIASGGTVSGTIQHPSGASGTFTFTVTRQGRSGVPTPAVCLTNLQGVAFADAQPAVYDVLALTKKAITGPNMPNTLTWTLGYTPTCSGNACASTKTTKVTDARGYDTVYTFGALYSTSAATDTEGQLQKLQLGGTSGVYLETDTYQYFANCGSTCPAVAGAPAQVRGDIVPLSSLRPIQTRVITREGTATYTQTSSNPDGYGYPQTIVRQEKDTTTNYTKTDTLTYTEDDMGWFLGWVTKKVSDNATEFSITPYSTLDVPKYVYRFGRLDKTYTYSTVGTEFGAINTVTDGDSNVSTYTNYVAGIPENVTYGDNATESAIVRYDGRVTQWTDADSNITTYTYDAMGRLNGITYPVDTPASTPRTFAWTTATSGWTETEKVGTYFKVTTYDGFLRPVLTNEDNLRYIKRAFDADGNVTAESYPHSSASSIGIASQYDGIGRLTQQKDSAGFATNYTPGSNSLVVEDRDGNMTTYAFQAYDTPSTAWPVTITTPIGPTRIVRDTWGKPTSITRGGIERDRGYNTNQLLDSITDPERSDALTFDYDGAGNLSHVYRNKATSETRLYDGRNRLKSVTYANGDPAVGVTYWPGGNLKTQSRGTNTHSYAYNKRHEIKTETIATDSGSYALTYTYDALAHLATFQYPDKSTPISFNPDDLGQPATVGSFANSLTYWPNGAVESFTYGNGITHTMTQTSDGRQLPSEVADSASVMDLTYSYDDNAQPTQIADSLHSTGRILKYDGGNRLLTAEADALWKLSTFTYDTLDNLTVDATTGTSTTTIAIDTTSNLPTSVKVGTTTMALSYDGEGNLTQKGTVTAGTTYTFDSANELTQLTTGGTAYSYGYDGKGLRATSSTSSGTMQGQQVDSVYTLSGQLVYESVTATGNPDRIFANGFENPVTATQTTKYYYLGNHTVAKEVTVGTTATDTYLHTDALGTPIAQTNSAKVIIGTSTDYPYGGLYSYTGTGNTAGLGFAGQYSDATGLIYMRARYVDPQLHRFISLDPVDVDAGTALNFNRFSYADNSPYAKYDPSGRTPWGIAIGGFIGYFGGVANGWWAGDAGYKLWATDGGAGALAGGIVGATDGLGLVAGLFVNTTADVGIEAARQEINYGEIKSPGSVVMAGMGGALGSATNILGNEIMLANDNASWLGDVLTAAAAGEASGTAVTAGTMIDTINDTPPMVGPLNTQDQSGTSTDNPSASDPSSSGDNAGG